MKRVHLIIITFLLLFSITINAQVNRSNDIRSNGMNSEAQMEEDRLKEFEKQKGKYIDKSVASLKKELELDALQEIAVKQIITESARIEGIILKKEESDESKIKDIEALAGTTDKKITALLNTVQKEKFIELKSNLKKKKK